MKKCFVIMPYGGNDEKAQKLYTGVYQTIVAAAARNAGYEPKRSDISAEPGNITHDIIRDLAESEIVVADLTTGNPNVFFELGIRHAFRKSGTVHIVNSAHSLPFDLSQYRVIKYSPTELADIPEVVKTIEDAIKKRELQSHRPDNPVHDALPELPIDIRATGDRAVLDQLRATQEELECLRDENEKINAELASLRPMEITGSNVNIDALLAQADEAMRGRGEFVILRLRQAMQDGGSDQFVAELRKVVKSPYLDENDFMEIEAICRKAGLNEHRRATLEIGHLRYPQQEKIFLALVDALDDSPNPADQNRGRAMVEDCLRIQHVDGMPKFSGKATFPNLREAFAMLFNYYNHLRRPDWVLAITDSIPKGLADDPMVVRNRARSLESVGRIEEAEASYKRAIELNPKDDQSYFWYSGFLDRQNREREAYEYKEKAILADPDDDRLYLGLGVDILNNGYHRTLAGTVAGPEERKIRPKFAVPFIVRALQGGSPEMLQEAVRILVRCNAVTEAQAIAAGHSPEGRYDTEALQWIVAKLEG